MARIITGTVSSDKGDKTIVVSVHTRKTHPIYQKQYSKTQKIMAHDEKNEAKVGDRVEITETRPLSARKRFTLTKIVEAAKLLHIEPEAEPKAKSAEGAIIPEKVESETKSAESGKAKVEEPEAEPKAKESK